MIRINLLPVRAAQRKEKLRTQVVVLVLSLLLAGAACGSLYLNKQWAIDDINAEIKDLQAQNNALKKKLGEVANYEKRKKDLQQKLDVLADLKTAKSGPVHLLDDLSLALPDKVWLTSFEERGGGVKLSGYGDTEKTVANFMNRLERSGYYSNVELSVTQQATIEGVKMQKFTLSCRTEKPSPN